MNNTIVKFNLKSKVIEQEQILQHTVVDFRIAGDGIDKLTNQNNLVGKAGNVTKFDVPVTFMSTGEKMMIGFQNGEIVDINSHKSARVDGPVMFCEEFGNGCIAITPQSIFSVSIETAKVIKITEIEFPISSICYCDMSIYISTVNNYIYQINTSIIPFRMELVHTTCSADIIRCNSGSFFFSDDKSLYKYSKSSMKLQKIFEKDFQIQKFELSEDKVAISHGALVHVFSAN